MLQNTAHNQRTLSSEYRMGVGEIRVTFEVILCSCSFAAVKRTVLELLDDLEY